ncbi:MAG: DEAD/DEAH box helicase [Bacteroidota bacterium]
MTTTKQAHTYTLKRVKKLIDQALAAVEAELEAVRERPSQDLLSGGTPVTNVNHEEYDYQFETHYKSIQYAELIKVDYKGTEREARPVEYEDEVITLRFEDPIEVPVDEMEVEWENDFVLRKLHGELLRLKEEPGQAAKRIRAMLEPEAVDGEAREVHHDGLRNKAQLFAIQQALKQQTLYVWGPPGTGKTATLGYIIANYLDRQKRVLFVSNTNRAVDVGLLSVARSMEQLGMRVNNRRLTRFGEAVLDHPQLEELWFDHWIEKRSQEQKEEAAKLSNTLDEYRALQDQIDEMQEADEEVSTALDQKCQLLGDKVDDYGGEKALEEQIYDKLNVNEMVELRRKKLVATTMAKVCTSELFMDMEFDAVVVDEASMANIPYLMVLANKVKEHMVIVGDPMQLPPIAITDDYKAKDFLGQDVFSLASNAESVEDLFAWHDAHPQTTCFFDTQYRLKEDLADLISKVFYQGRLKTAEATGVANVQFNDSSSSNPSVSVLDTSKFAPKLDQKTDGRGFQPVNEVHQFLLEKLVRRFLLKHQVPMEEIGIIVPFRSAVYDVRRKLRESNYGDVEVGTIHTFQGREKEVILFDTVMSGEVSSHGYYRDFSVRPFDEAKNGLSVPRLLNVACSRSKRFLVVLADMRHMRTVYQGKFMGNLLDKIQNEQDS